jgi:hypothetical protein
MRPALLAGALFAGLGGGSALADTVYDFTFTANSNPSLGGAAPYVNILDGQFTINSSNVITGVTGTVTAAVTGQGSGAGYGAITSMGAINSFYGNDNQYFPTPTTDGSGNPVVLLDYNGVAFNVGGDALLLYYDNVPSDNGYQYYNLFDANGNVDTFGSLSVTAPDPAPGPTPGRGLASAIAIGLAVLGFRAGRWNKRTLS